MNDTNGPGSVRDALTSLAMTVVFGVWLLASALAFAFLLALFVNLWLVPPVSMHKDLLPPGRVVQASLIAVTLAGVLAWFCNTVLAALAARHLAQAEARTMPGPWAAFRLALAAWRGTLTVAIAGTLLTLFLLAVAGGYALMMAAGPAMGLVGTNWVLLIVAPAGMVVLVLLMILARRGHWACLCVEKPDLWGLALIWRLTKSVLPPGDMFRRLGVHLLAVWLPLAAALTLAVLSEVSRMSSTTRNEFQVLFMVGSLAALAILALGAGVSMRQAAGLFTRHRDRLTGVPLGLAVIPFEEPPYPDATDKPDTVSPPADHATRPPRKAPVVRLMLILIGLPLVAFGSALVGMWAVWFSPPATDYAYTAQLRDLYLPADNRDNAATWLSKLGSFYDSPTALIDEATASRLFNPLLRLDRSFIDTDLDRIVRLDEAWLRTHEAAVAEIWQRARKAPQRRWQTGFDADLLKSYFSLRIATSLRQPDAFQECARDLALVVECDSVGREHEGDGGLAIQLANAILSHVALAQPGMDELQQLDQLVGHLLDRMDHPDAWRARAMLNALTNDPSVEHPLVKMTSGVYTETDPRWLYVPFGWLEWPVVDADTEHRDEAIVYALKQATAESGPQSLAGDRIEPWGSPEPDTLAFARFRRTAFPMVYGVYRYGARTWSVDESANRLWAVRFALRVEATRRITGDWPADSTAVIQQPPGWLPLAPLPWSPDRLPPAKVQVHEPIAAWVPVIPLPEDRGYLTTGSESANRSTLATQVGPWPAGPPVPVSAAIQRVLAPLFTMGQIDCRWPANGTPEPTVELPQVRMSIAQALDLLARQVETPMSFSDYGSQQWIRWSARYRQDDMLFHRYCRINAAGQLIYLHAAGE